MVAVVVVVRIMALADVHMYVVRDTPVKCEQRPLLPRAVLEDRLRLEVLDHTRGRVGRQQLDLQLCRRDVGARLVVLVHRQDLVVLDSAVSRLEVQRRRGEREEPCRDLGLSVRSAALRAPSGKRAKGREERTVPALR